MHLPNSDALPNMHLPNSDDTYRIVMHLPNSDALTE